MFGMGFSELLVIAVIAVLFLGPDKLPSTMVEIAKFFRNIKQTLHSVKTSINEEIHLEEIKKEAMEYKQKLLETQEKINTTVNLNTLNEEINTLIENEAPPKSDAAIKPSYEQPTFTREDAIKMQADEGAKEDTQTAQKSKEA